VTKTVGEPDVSYAARVRTIGLEQAGIAGHWLRGNSVLGPVVALKTAEALLLPTSPPNIAADALGTRYTANIDASLMHGKAIFEFKGRLIAIPLLGLYSG
jgi:hypothetical protein